MTLLATKLYTTFFGRFAGRDDFGNRYFYAINNNKKRWVVYKDIVDPTSVPAEWHGWLHKITDDIPSQTRYKRYKWQKKHQSNQTGSANAYFPPGHSFGGGKRAKATGDYTAWNPNKIEEKNG